MALKLMYITNKENIAKIAEQSGVDWVFVDLEMRGKAERQGHRNTVISDHKITDVNKVKAVLNSSKLMVRVNPPHQGSEAEIERVVKDGADIVMLPYFKTVNQVTSFINHVNGRAKTCLLLETPEAVDAIDSIINLPGIDYIHIGLNDLHLAYGMHFMFELLADGTVEKLCKKIGQKNITYGFGGIARIGKLVPPAESIIAEHYRLGSTMVILSRSFCNTSEVTDEAQISAIFNVGVKEIRAFEARLQTEDASFFETNRVYVRDKIMEVASTIKNK